MEKADMGISAKDFLTLEFQNQSKYAMSCWMLRAEIEREGFGIAFFFDIGELYRVSGD
jgi:hypothetical protein